MMKSFSAGKQKGVTLIVSLVILLIMTIIGLQGISSTTLEERMARNYRDSQLSFQAAETALRDAEELVNTTSFVMGNYSSTCVNGLCFNGTAPGTCPAANPGGIVSGNTLIDPSYTQAHWLNPAVMGTAGNYIVYSGTITGVFAQPRYIIEFRCYVQADPAASAPDAATYGLTNEWAEMYRITALGFGASDNSRTMLQSTFKKPL
jgi:type IV pilus assembly protein PilX